jgi:group II intron reverse transcriptase/maturase
MELLMQNKRLNTIDEYVNNISKFVKEHEGVRFQGLSSKINEDILLEVHRKMVGKKAVGVDKVSKTEYEKDLEGNVENLVKRLKLDSYNPKPSRRVHIPKLGNKGQTRPLGISCYEDKLVETAVAKLLSAVYEPKFMEFSYGFRPGRSCHGAISELRNTIMTHKINYVVEADIKSFFDSIDHEWMIKFLEHDIADKKLMRLVMKFLKAGILEDGEHVCSEEGTPQGNAMSPVLANIYLQYVLDIWFEKVVKKQCVGEAYIVRYCDDFVCTFQYEGEAKRFMKMLEERLKNFSLELAKDKTRLLEFGKYAKENRAKRGRNKPETFNFLGFTFCCGKARSSNKFNVILRTERKRFNEKLKKLRIWLHNNRTTPVKMMIERVNRSLIGHYNYYGVPTNVSCLSTFRRRIDEAIFKTLNRRSQRRSYTWPEFRNKVLARFPLVEPKIYVRI